MLEYYLFVIPILYDSKRLGRQAAVKQVSLSWDYLMDQIKFSPYHLGESPNYSWYNKWWDAVHIAGRLSVLCLERGTHTDSTHHPIDRVCLPNPFWFFAWFRNPT